MMSRYDLMGHDGPTFPPELLAGQNEFSWIRLSVYQLFKPEAATAAQKPTLILCYIENWTPCQRTCHYKSVTTHPPG